MAANELKDFYKLSDEYLKHNTITDENELFVYKALRYIGYLYNITGDRPKSSLVISDDDVNKLKFLFDDIYPHKSYTKAEMTYDKILPLYMTLEIFTKVFKTKEDQKRIAPVLLKLIGDFPNAETIEEIKEVLAKGVLKF